MLRKLSDWSEKLSPTSRRIINVIIVVFIACGSATIFLKFIIPYLIANATLSTMTTAEAIATTGVIVTITVTAINMISASMNKRYSSKKQLSLSVSVQKTKVIITSTIENKGTGRITPKSFYLFINKGNLVTNKGYTEYEFPNILKHECGEFDCSLAKKCKAARMEKIPDELLGENFKNSLSICKIFNHIAADSVNFIDPGEIFSEDCIFELEPGVYRVILLGISVEADCMCAHKIFIVEEDEE